MKIESYLPRPDSKTQGESNVMPYSGLVHVVWKKVLCRTTSPR